MSPNTDIHGSFTNLIDYLFIRDGSGVPFYQVSNCSFKNLLMVRCFCTDCPFGISSFLAITLLTIMRPIKKRGKISARRALKLRNIFRRGRTLPSGDLQCSNPCSKPPAIQKIKGCSIKTLMLPAHLTTRPASPQIQPSSNDNISSAMSKGSLFGQSAAWARL